MHTIIVANQDNYFFVADRAELAADVVSKDAVLEYRCSTGGSGLDRAESAQRLVQPFVILLRLAFRGRKPGCSRLELQPRRATPFISPRVLLR